MDNKRKVCIVTGTRAEWGLLSGIAQQLRMRDDVELQIVATNMHLDPRYGHTIDDILAQGFEVDVRVPMMSDDDSTTSTVKAMAKCLDGMADALAQLTPDMIVILGDRYEMLSVASAATVMRIPIVHLHGGEISEGAIDDSIRHAITKLSSLHLTATEEYRNRVIQMGENPDRVINTGAIGVYNVAHIEPMSLDELNESLNFDITPGTLLVTYHPATLDDEDVALRCQALLDALDAFPDNKVSTVVATSLFLCCPILCLALSRMWSMSHVAMRAKPSYISSLNCSSVRLFSLIYASIGSSGRRASRHSLPMKSIPCFMHHQSCMKQF